MNILTNPKIQKIFSAPDVKHGLSLFSPIELNAVEELIVEQNGKYLIKCQIKDRFKAAKPEEVVRQLWIYKLLTEFGYQKKQIDVEGIIDFGSRVGAGRVDIVVFNRNLRDYYMLFEIKRPHRNDGLEQLKSYCNAKGAPIGIWSNGNEIIRLYREEPNIFVEIPRIPRATETLKDILTERWTLKWLNDHDELKQGKTTLKKIILDLEELVLGNAGVKAFDEVFKLIYAKLYDEWQAMNDPNYQLDFFAKSRDSAEVKRAITNLFEGAKRIWPGVFEITDKIELTDSHLKTCVSFLEKIKLFHSNLRIIDEAFEYLIPDVSKKKEGQFFTPRPVMDMVIKMLNPKANEFIIDPACGSAGFLLHSVMWIAGKVSADRDLPQVAKDFAQNNIYGIDFAKEAVKISKAINLIMGDGKSHIYGGGAHGNALNPSIWNDEMKSGLRPRLLRFPNNQVKDRENQDNFLYFDFDVLMTNPPFAGTIKEKEVLKFYNLAKRKGRVAERMERHILFIERSLQFVRPGGRLAIVLPQGIFNNASAEYIRRFIIEEARILAVVGLHANTFKPHTGTKTSVLFLRKYTEEEKDNIQKIKKRYEIEWDKYIEEIKEKYKDIKWDSNIDYDQVDEKLKSFIISYFETSDDSNETDIKDSENKKVFKNLVNDLQDLEDLLNEKKSELNSDITKERKKELNKNIKFLQSEADKLIKEISKITLGGQIFLVLNEQKIMEQFKDFWLEEKIMAEIDYPIFFAVNQKPLKNNRGEYIFMKKSDGSFIYDDYGYPKIDHDLDEIAEAFIEFAKQQLKKGDNTFDFWRS